MNSRTCTGVKLGCGQGLGWMRRPARSGHGGAKIGVGTQHPQKVSVRAGWVQCSLGGNAGVHLCDLPALACVVFSCIPYHFLGDFRLSARQETLRTIGESVQCL